MLRPIGVLTCYVTRRKIGAYLDGALDSAAARSAERHLARCAGCTAEADALRRLKSAVRALPQPADPDWTGFWPGVVRGIEAARRQPAVARRGRRFAFRWAYGGLVAAALAVSVTVWRLVPGPSIPESSVIVQSAATAQPGGTVMVYSTPERDLTVIWVFGLPPEGGRE